MITLFWQAQNIHVWHTQFNWTNITIIQNMMHTWSVCSMWESLPKTIPQFQSSVSEAVRSISVIIVSRSSFLGWLSHVCNLHRFVHFKPLPKHWHSGSLHLRLHLHNNSCNTASRAGYPRIQSMVIWTSSFLTQPRLTGFGTCGWCWRMHLHMPAC